jgi:amidophosphoribosyltransferase
MCGITGITDSTDVSGSLYLALYALQHRGQESAGIYTYDGETVHKYKGYGLVSEVFSGPILDGLRGKTGIGHVRYPTTGGSKPENIQPFHFMFRGHSLSLVHNGNLINTDELRYEYEGHGHIFSTTSDTEVIAAILANEIIHDHTPDEAISYCMRKISGSYVVIFMLDGILYAFRDPLGIKPLCLGKTETGGHVLASESVALDAIGAEFVRDICPGESVRLQGGEVFSRKMMKAKSCAHCMFEYVYFARADAVIDGVSVYDVRRKTGALLAKEAPANADLISPVPDSGTAAATGFSRESGIPFREALIKNRYTGRTFIMPSQEKREIAVRMKLNPVRGHIKDKSVVLVDDSIVRGTTSKKILSLVREFGAKELHLRIASPPIIAPCYLGTDFPTRDELIASTKSASQVEKEIDATSLAHISLDGLIKAIGIPRQDLCLGCLTGKYPLAIPGEKEDERGIEMVDSYSCP